MKETVYLFFKKVIFQIRFLEKKLYAIFILMYFKAIIF